MKCTRERTFDDIRMLLRVKTGNTGSPGVSYARIRREPDEPTRDRACVLLRKPSSFRFAIYP